MDSVSKTEVLSTTTMCTCSMCLASILALANGTTAYFPLRGSLWSFVASMQTAFFGPFAGTGAPPAEGAACCCAGTGRCCCAGSGCCCTPNRLPKRSEGAG